MKLVNTIFVLLYSLALFGQSIDDKSEVKNVILIIGDGMGLSQVYAAMSVSSEPLNLERTHYFGFAKTYSLSNYVTDSGAGATAMSTGVKTNNKAIAVDSAQQKLMSITTLANDKGLSTGVIATSTIMHATPAAFLASSLDRYDTVDIAKGIAQSGVDVIIGGGARLFESLDLFDTLSKYGYQVQPDINAIEVNDPRPLISLPFSSAAPKISNGRGDFLPMATQITMDKLSRNKNGFFLMVEGSQIDWACHQNDINYVVDEVLDLDKAVGKAYDFADANPGTLVIVTADHETGGLALVNGSVKEKDINTVFSSTNHTGVMVPIYAYGSGAEYFSAIMENTEIFVKISKLMKLNTKIDESIVTYD